MLFIKIISKLSRLPSMHVDNVQRLGVRRLRH